MSGSRLAFLVALGSSASLGFAAFLVGIIYNPETHVQVVFDWEQAPVSAAALTMTVGSAGPLTHGNSISIIAASFTIAEPMPLGHISFVIWVTGNKEAGEIRFSLPSAVEVPADLANGTARRYESSFIAVSATGNLRLPADGEVVLKAHLRLEFQNGTWQRWSDNAGPSLVLREGQISAGPLSDYYTFLGLKATAAAVFAGAAVQVPVAIGAFARLYEAAKRRRKEPEEDRAIQIDRDDT